MRVAPQIVLSEQDRCRLETLAAAPDTPARLAQRARIILLAAQGEQNKSIAPRLGVGRAKVARWRERFAYSGLECLLHDLAADATDRCEEDAFPAVPGARDGGGGLASGGCVAEILGCYAAPPQHALVLSFTEQGRQGSVAVADLSPSGPAYRRSLAASLVTALRWLDTGLRASTPRDIGHQSWLAFLHEVEATAPPGRQIRVLADNPASHQHADVQHWLRRHPRITVQLAPNTAEWLRMVQRMLRDAQTPGHSGFPAGIAAALAAIESATRARLPAPYRWMRTPECRDVAIADDPAPAPCRGRATPDPLPCAVPPQPMVPLVPIASTKVLPPRGARQLMPREALMRRLVDARRQRCVLIQGQAGSGKTSTLMAWRKAMIPLGYDVSWLSLSVEDNEPARFFDYLLASIGEVDAAAAREASQVLDGGYDDAAIERWAVTLVQSLARRKRELVLMIDDLQHISDRRILQALQWLLDYAPPPLHVAMASRSALGLSLAQLRLQGQLAEFDMRDLRFSLEESTRYLRDQLGDIDSHAAVALHAQTDGWVAGLQLLALSLRGRQAGSHAAAPAGAYPATQLRDASAFASFFEREVLIHLASEDLDMLTRVAICQRFCVPLCADILGRPGNAADIRDRLSRMVANHLFITPVGSHDAEAWYRIHPLLRETLLGSLAARAEPEQRAMHAAAWRWFETHGHVDEAVLHAVKAGEVDAAASLVEGCAQTLLFRGELNQVASLLRMLPEQQVRQRFGLHLVMAFLQMYGRDFDALRISLASLDEDAASRDENRQYALCLLRAGMALQLDDTEEAAALLPRIWDVPKGADGFSWHARTSVLSWVLTMRGDHDLARAVLQESDRPGRSTRGNLLARCLHANSLARDGQIRQAGAIVREVMEEAERCGAAHAALAGIAAALLADSLYELNETEKACELLEPRIGTIERTALPEFVLRARVVLSNCHWVAGRPAQALVCLERLEAYASRYRMDRLLAEALAQRLRRHLELGEMEKAGSALGRLEALAQCHAGPAHQMGLPAGRAAARAAVDMALFTRDFAAAVTHIRLLMSCEQGERPQGHARLRLQLAIARLGLGETAAARDDFVDAIRTGHRLGLSRTLLDVLDFAPDAFDVFAREPLADPVLDFHVQQLQLARHAMAHRPGQDAASASAAGPITSLSDREREILDLLAKAMSNKKIARALNVSAETVKWHLKNVYAKLGVGGRGGAAALLRDRQERETAAAQS